MQFCRLIQEIFSLFIFRRWLTFSKINFSLTIKHFNRTIYIRLSSGWIREDAPVEDDVIFFIPLIFSKLGNVWKHQVIFICHISHELDVNFLLFWVHFLLDYWDSMFVRVDVIIISSNDIILIFVNVFFLEWSFAPGSNIIFSVNLALLFSVIGVILIFDVANFNMECGLLRFNRYWRS